MRKYLLVPFVVSLLFLSNVYGQEKSGGQQPPRAGHPREETDVCADLSGRSSATHQFRQMGETIEIPLRGDSVPASLSDCEPVALDLHWSDLLLSTQHFLLLTHDEGRMLRLRE